jgi:hypothetical protein
MNKIKFILFFLMLLPLCVKPIVLDSLHKEELIKQGIFKLNALKASNLQKIKEGKTSELNFIVNLEPDNTTDYINDYNLPTKPKFLSGTSVEQTLNTRLQQVFTNNYKECYLILIDAFDVEIKAPVPSGLTTQDVFNKGKFFDEQSDIETHKNFHNDVVNQIVNSNSITNNNRDCYVLSIGAYCGAFYSNQIGCYYYWFTKKVDIQGNPTVQFFQETYDYLTAYLKNSNDFKHPASRDNMAEQVVTAFENAAKNAELKAQILTTYTSPALENILSNFTKTEDYSTLTLEERIHILKIFLTSLTFSSSETYINNVLRTTPKQNVNDLLSALLDSQYNINGNCLLYRLYSGVQGNNYTTLITDLCHLVGRSSIDGHNLPINTTNYTNLQTSAFVLDENWYRAFEWTDCWNRTNPSDLYDPDNVSLNACNWTDFEKRFSNISISSDGNIVVSGFYDSGEDGITAPGDPPFNPIKPLEHTYHPYDLIVFVNKSGIESINEATADGVVVVPALFLKFAYDKAFNQGIYDVAYTNISILGLLGVDEIMLASKVLGKVPKMKSLLKWIWREGVLSEASNILTKLENPLFAQLKGKINSLDEVNRIKFLDDFVNATDNTLTSLNNELDLVDVWKKWSVKGVKEIDELKAFKSVWTKNIRGVSFDDFYAKTSYQIGKANNKKFAAELYEAWKLKDVSTMELTYTKYGLDPTSEYPPCEGIWGVTEIKTPANNDIFDRFQYGQNLTGSYASPLADQQTVYSVQSRALMENYFDPLAEALKYGDYYYIKFKIKDNSNLIFEYGEAIPWFGKSGGAIQIKSNIKFTSLNQNIEIIEKYKFDLNTNTWMIQ